ncbi:hypothetical protein TNCT_25751 [Trichonephila clavata]|uniref:Mos1 transposase HTH domain-containing protein n=1 Tax=Trichonephila clavata TaxID=2740835 RepID=A0A8X6LKM4_TRICU|nr:hypothetical protein TNCT_25751 [Trichonephila clavata]
MVARRFYADEVVSVVYAPLRSPGTDAGDRHWPISPRIVRPPHPPGATKKRKVIEYDKLHIRHIMTFEFKLHGNAAETNRKIYSLHPGFKSKNQVQYWFKKLREENFNVKNEPKSAWPMNVDNDYLKALIKSEFCLVRRGPDRILY